MGRIVCIDWGSKRCGLAWTDELQILASGVGVYSEDELVAKLLDEEVLPQIEEIVVGYPLRDDGSDTDASEGIKSFVGRLQKTFEGMPIKLVDESFSSKRAKEEIVKAGVPKMKRRNKGLLDQVSATLILQDYLDNR